MRHDATPVGGQHGVESLPIVQCVMAAIRGKAKTVAMQLGETSIRLDRMLSRGKLFTQLIAVSC
jgi:hypothetical protein